MTAAVVPERGRVRAEAALEATERCGHGQRPRCGGSGGGVGVGVGVGGDSGAWRQRLLCEVMGSPRCPSTPPPPPHLPRLALGPWHGFVFAWGRWGSRRHRRARHTRWTVPPLVCRRRGRGGGGAAFEDGFGSVGRVRSRDHDALRLRLVPPRALHHRLDGYRRTWRRLHPARLRLRLRLRLRAWTLWRV